MIEDSPEKFITLLKNKRYDVEKQLKKIDKIIYDNETKYLEETVNGGNIFRGWEHIFTSKSKFPHNINSIKKPRISNNERLFSQSNINNNYLKNDIIGVNNINKNNDLSNSSNQNNNNLIQRNSINNNSNFRYKKKITQSLSIKKKKINSGEKDKKIEILPL